MSGFAVLAALVVVAHLAFVGVAAFGGLVALKWPRFAFVQIPAAAWGAYVELTGGICPLTPLENALRRRAGFDLYSSDFVARYIFPVLYPDGLTRDAQTAIGILVVLANLAAYGYLLRRHRKVRRQSHR